MTVPNDTKGFLVLTLNGTELYGWRACLSNMFASWCLVWGSITLLAPIVYFIGEIL